MTRIVDHRSALPFGPVVEVHARHDPDAEPPVFATVSVSTFGASPDPEAFPQPLPVADAFLQALAYAERVGIACVWIRPRRPLPAGETPCARRERALSPNHRESATANVIMRERANSRSHCSVQTRRIKRTSKSRTRAPTVAFRLRRTSPVPK